MGDDWFDPLANFLGPAYLRNAFTYGTEQEVGFLVDALGLEAGMRVLDIGCGPGRHSLALARRGIHCVGIDRSVDFVGLATAAAEAEGLAAEFVAADVRELHHDAEFDAAICLCQGGFGLLRGEESAGLLARFARALRPGGHLALTAFHSYFAVRYLEPDRGDAFDPATGVHHEQAELRNDAGERRTFDLWTTCFTARELELLARAAGLEVGSVSGVRPGEYRVGTPRLDDPELLLIAIRPGQS